MKLLYSLFLRNKILFFYCTWNHGSHDLLFIIKLLLVGLIGTSYNGGKICNYSEGTHTYHYMNGFGAVRTYIYSTGDYIMWLYNLPRYTILLLLIYI